MNPAITVAMWRYGTFPGEGVPYYLVAQLSGSILGVAVGRLVWGRVIAHPPTEFAVLQPAQGWGFGSLFVVETLTMATIVLIVGLLLADRRFAALVPFAVGLLIGGTIAGLGTVTGGSVNPARQFGPAVLSGQTRLLAAYLLAPIVGALLAPVVRARLQQSSLLTHALCGPQAIRAANA
jgi:glycerol uptake facilitator protein/aquaporin Z